MFPILMTATRRMLPLLALAAGTLVAPHSAPAAPLTDFAFDLQPRLGSPDQNLTWSPASLGQALALLYGGASGVTRAEMAATLRWPAGVDATQSAWGAALRELAGRGAGKAGVEGRPFQLSLASAVWTGEGLLLRPEFAAGLAEHFSASARPLPFRSDSEKARQQINGWVAERTTGMIPELLRPGLLSPDTRLVLTTAAYLDARWEQPFESVHRDWTFTRLDRSTVKTLMMTRQASLAAARGPGWVAAALPYHDPRLEMVIVVPDSNFRAFERGWTLRKYQEIVAAFTTRTTSVALPPFRLDADLDLTGPLAAAGMQHLFARADLSGITAQETLFVNRVVQKAVLRVGREGTVGAAATAVELRSAMLPDRDTLHLEATRPFLFVLRDRPTGAILFMGRVVDPTV